MIILYLKNKKFKKHTGLNNVKWNIIVCILISVIYN